LLWAFAGSGRVEGEPQKKAGAVDGARLRVQKVRLGTQPWLEEKQNLQRDDEVSYFAIPPERHHLTCLSNCFRRGRKHSLLVYDDEDDQINFSELSLGASSKNNKDQQQQQQQSSEASLTKMEEHGDAPINNNLHVESNNRTQVTEETIQVSTFAEQKSESPKVVICLL